MLVDTHCHLDMLGDLDGAQLRARAAGVERIVTIGVDLPTSEWAVLAAERIDDVWATVGLHPHDARLRTDQTMSRIAELAEHPRVVGVGEAGLDFHYDNSPREVQRQVFAEQIEIAKATGKALVIHSREAWDETFEILHAAAPLGPFVFHCFSGGPAEAERAVSLGATLSFSGVITFKNASSLREAAQVTPLDRIVVETDAPFLAPAPHRGKPNEPAYVAEVAAAVAAAKQIETEALVRASGENAARLFGWL